MSVNKLVLFPGALGDFLCFYPTLEWLRRLDPEGQLAVRLRHDLGDLFDAGDGSLVVGSLECREIGSLFVRNAYTESSLANFFGRFDEIYSWTGFRDETFRENLMRLASGKVRLFPFRPESSCEHMPGYYLSCAGGTCTAMERVLLPIRPSARAWAADYLHERGIADVPLLALGLGSGAREKNWPIEHFAAISEWWRKHGISLFIIGPVEREWAKVEELDCAGALTVEGLSLDQVAALLERCRGMVGNDSGMTHLAAAVGIPTFAIFGPTNPGEWRPWGPKVTVIASDLPCSPCGLIAMKACSHQSCLRDLRVEVLIGALKENLFLGKS